ncbi:uncharacterized protein LOC135467550 [Liolophura sinensis]|uniref:uncharacterized protein LOC135467550 n=1 Tax=Liolophura sinensis TaxID=3198878 RepID=UPI00315956FE
MASSTPNSAEELYDGIRRYISKLEKLWTEIGIDEQQQSDRRSTVYYHLQNLMMNMLEEEECMKAKLQENIESFGEELIKLYKELGLPLYQPEKMSMIQLEKVLRTKLTSVKKEKLERMKLLKELRSEDQTLCDKLCSTPYYIPTGVVPTQEQIQALQDHIAALTAEEAKRFKEFTTMKSTIVSILKDLEKDPDTSFEREVVCERDESFILSPENIIAVQELQTELQTEQREIMSRVEGLKNQVETLWERLALPQEERDAFLVANTGYKHTVVKNMRLEIARCEALKLENMQKFIDRVRKELVVWWDKCYLSQEERNEFTSFKDDNYTEELLERHDKEVTKMKARYECQKNILEKLAKREKLFQEMIEFEKKASDPNRLFKDRGGSMLREEKARKKLLKELPKVEQDAREAILAWEQSNDQDFLVRGVKFDEYVDKQWESYKEEIVKQKEERQKQRANGDSSTTPIKRRFMGTPTKTPNKHRRLNETGQRTPCSSIRQARSHLTSTLLSSACRPPRPSPSGKTPRALQRRSQRLARRALGEINEKNKGASVLFSHTTVSGTDTTDAPTDITTTGSYQEFAIMPIAASQKDNQVRYRHILPKPPGYPGHLLHHHHNSQVSPTSGNVGARYSHDSAAILPELGHLSAMSAAANSSGESFEHFFSTHSPPILNLSPNLSPTEPQRTSPFYDLRETTRRRSLQDLHNSYNQQMQHSPQLYSGILADESGRKSESPSRKRRKTSNNVIDLTANSPSPPPSRPWESSGDGARPSRRRLSSGRRVSAEQRCHTPRARRSPVTRRRTRDRNSMIRPSDSPERRAFQPPVLPNRLQPNPSVLQSLPGHRPHPSQQGVFLDMDRVPVSAAVTVPPYAIPVCNGTHHIPACTSAHIPVCTSQPTWSIPSCSVQLPTSCIQHIPTCSLQQLPIPHALPPMLPHTHQHTHHASPLPSHQHHPAHHHLPPPPQFPASHHSQPRRLHEEEIQIIAEHRPPYPPHLPPGLHHQGAPLNPSPPVLLQEPSVHPSPHDIYGPYGRISGRRSVGRSRLRSGVPGPPAPYPGFLLQFLAMLGNPQLPPYGISMDINDEATEVENYEALLNLAERLGEAKPRGLTKPEIEQLPHYRFNTESHRSDTDQTSCVVCMCDFESRQMLRVLPCSHEFHTKCVDKWLKTNRTCPICRADASETASCQSD